MSINFLRKGKNTSDATATANDILYPKTAYVDNEKIVGNIIPTYKIAGLTSDIYIINNTGLGIYDIRYDLGYALVGNRGETSFYICKIIDNELNLENGIKILLSSFDSGYTVRDLKFNMDNISNNIITFFGVGTKLYGYTNRNVYEMIFKVYYDIKNKTFTFDKTVYGNVSTRDWFTYTAPTNSKIYIIDKDLFMVKMDYITCYNNDEKTNPPRKIYKSENGKLILLKAYTRDFNNYNEQWNGETTEAYVSKKLYIEYSNKKYMVYKLDESYNFSLLTYGLTNNTNRAALIGQDLYLLGTKLYNTDKIELMDYVGILSATTYKQCIKEYIYELDYSNRKINIFKFNSDTYEIEFYKTLSDVIDSYNLSTTDVKSKAYSNTQEYICYGINTGIKYYIDMIANSEEIEKLKINQSTFITSVDASASNTDILFGKTAYLKDGKTKGSMPNNGELNYTPTTESQSIPEGYTSGGTITAVTSDIDSNIVPENIKKGTNILGINGTLESFDSCFSTNKNYSALNLKAGFTKFPTVDMTNIISLQNTFTSCDSLVEVEYLDTSAVTNMTNAFSSCSKLKTVPLLDTSSVTTFRRAFYGDEALETVPEFNTSACTNFASMFEGCTILTTVPTYNLSNATTIAGMFTECPALNEDSLNNILSSLLTVTDVFTDEKTLSNLGLTSEQATICTTLSNWTNCETSGWTTGYETETTDTTTE